MPLKLVELEGVSRSNAYQIPPEHLQPGENPRNKPDTEVLELAQSILEHGQLVPVVIYTDKQGEPHILDGNRRVTAIRYINENGLNPAEPLKVRCEVYKGENSYEASIAATHKRKGFSPIDLAYIMRTLESNGRTRKEIAKLLECSETLISTTLQLAELPADLQRKVHRGELPAVTAYEMVSMPAEAREQVMEESRAEAKAAGKPEATAKVTRQHVRKVKREKVERGEQTAGPVGLSRKEIRNLFAEFAGCQDGTIEEPILKLCSTVVKCIDGEAGPRAVLNRMRELMERQ
jgi:ParB/RepB/Spo0J family partition protein